VGGLKFPESHSNPCGYRMIKDQEEDAIEIIIRRLVAGVTIFVAVLTAVLSVAGPGLVPAILLSFLAIIGAAFCRGLGACRTAILALIIVSPTLGIGLFLKWFPLDPTIAYLNMAMMVVILIVGVVLFRDYRASRRGAPQKHIDLP